ncbi:MAG: hypothetical protein ABSA75_06555 [Candidatus Bathyarchaeia archaeon]|jgi:integrase
MTQNEDIFTEYFKDWLLTEGKVNAKVAHEYIRIVKKFLVFAKGFPNEDVFNEKVKEFLEIENPHSYRNTLAALKKAFEFIGQKEMMQNFKYKAIMPSFSIKTPSLADMVTFGRAIKNKRIQVYYYLGVVSAIRPEHLLRLRKDRFDKENKMINTFMKTFGKKKLLL